MTIENEEFWQGKVMREKALQAVERCREYERTHKMYSKKLKSGTIISAKSPKKIEEVIKELKKNGSIL